MINGNAAVSIGTDIVDVERIEVVIKKFGDAFLARVFTASELEYCTKLVAGHLSLAARFAAKEALSKALATGIGICSPLKW
jgi:holo-[acyl-carrier protein] synthase